jgi:Mrp family chromosome partitioning ATPase
MSDLLNRLRKEYAHILIDSPPSTAVTDPAVLSKSVDGVVLVIRAGDTAREMVKNGIGQFEAVGAHILGAILNGVDIGRDKYYYYYQYYHYYYGDDGDKKKRKNRKKRSKKKSGD